MRCYIETRSLMSPWWVHLWSLGALSKVPQAPRGVLSAFYNWLTIPAVLSWHCSASCIQNACNDEYAALQSQPHWSCLADSNCGRRTCWSLHCLQAFCLTWCLPDSNLVSDKRCLELCNGCDLPASHINAVMYPCVPGHQGHALTSP